MEESKMTHNVLITGGSRGIGEGIVTYLASHGCHIAFTYRSSAEAAEALALRLAEKYQIRIKAIQCEVRELDSVQKAFEEALSFLGDLDTVVNNAGITKDGGLMTMEASEWQDVIDVNLGGTFNMCRCAVTTLLRRKAGSIINISSVSGLLGIKGQTNYAASKAGIIGFTRSLAKECAKRGVTVNAIAPGFIETEMTETLTEPRRKEALDQVPMKRFGKVSDVAAMVHLLMSEQGRYITGQTIVIDGGLSA